MKKILLMNNEISDLSLQEETRVALQAIEMGPLVFTYNDVNDLNIYCTGSRGKGTSYIYLRNNEKNLLLQALFPEQFPQTVTKK